MFVIGGVPGLADEIRREHAAIIKDAGPLPTRQSSPSRKQNFARSGNAWR
jgi:hypothetical protein